MGSHRRGRFRLNKRDKKIAGVCAGIADHFDVDVTLVRLAVALVILSTLPMGLIAYWVAAIVAEKGERRPCDANRELQTPWPPSSTAEATRDRIRDLDARLAAIESSVKDDKSALAREIDALR